MKALAPLDIESSPQLAKLIALLAVGPDWLHLSCMRTLEVHLFGLRDR
jgi:hypothetical protein